MLKIASETDRFEKFWGTGFRLLPGGVLHPSPNFPSLRLAYNIPPPTYIFYIFGSANGIYCMAICIVVDNICQCLLD